MAKEDSEPPKKPPRRRISHQARSALSTDRPVAARWKWPTSKCERNDAQRIRGCGGDHPKRCRNRDRPYGALKRCERREMPSSIERNETSKRARDAALARSCPNAIPPFLPSLTPSRGLLRCNAEANRERTARGALLAAMQTCAEIIPSFTGT